MTTPVNPPPDGSTPPSSQPQPAGQPAQPPTSLPTSYVDPTGAWAKFLSTPGAAATGKEVQLFMVGLLKFFNVIIQQQQDAAKRALDKLKQTGQGNG